MILSLYRENKQSLQFIFSSLWKHKKVFYIFLLWESISGAFLFIFPLIAKYEIDQLVDKKQSFFGIFLGSPLWVFFLIISTIFILKFFEKLIESAIDLIQYQYVKFFQIDYEKLIFQKLSQVSLWLFLNSRHKRILSECLSWSYHIEGFMRGVLGPFLRNSIAILGILMVISYFYLPLISIILFSSFTIYIFQKHKERAQLQNEAGENYEYEYRLDRLKYEMEENMHQVVINGGSKLLEIQFEACEKHLLKNFQMLQKTQIFFDMSSFCIENIWNILIKILVGYFVLQGTQSLGFMTMILLYITQFESAVQSFMHMKFQTHRFEDTLQRLKLFLGLTQWNKNSISSTELIPWNIEIKNLSFSYPNISQLELEYFEILEKRIKKYKKGKNESDEDELYMIEEAKKEAQIIPPKILKNISLSFQKGNIYGIVGKNGAGKTTLIQNILWFFDNYEGEIFFWTQEYKSLYHKELYQYISVVSQTPYILLTFTIRENILLGVEKSYSDDEIYVYLKKFHLDTKIRKLRLWLDTKIGYDSDFSGGEKQILVLIRNILQNRYILILDEWTNQLDAENELLVMDELLKNKNDKIIVFITHRMTTIRKADMIYCIDDWLISAKGKHEQLLAEKNIYEKFWKKQVEG